MDTAGVVRAPAARVDRAGTARRLVAAGGRFSTALGIDLEAGEVEIERWFLAATLFGARIPTTIAERAFHVLDEAGVTVATAREFSWEDLVALLDRGGYARYDYKTATRLQKLCDALGERYGGRVCAIPARAATSAELESALDALPGWGPVTVGVFLRELRGIWPLASCALDTRAAASARHLGLVDRRAKSLLGPVRDLALAAGVDQRDLEGALVRNALAHHGDFQGCPGGRRCTALRLLAPSAPVATAAPTSTGR
ncbi:MAG TPA: hypothetical protein VED63_12570 [Acidimicrobiales bacterium]|nr:hypothetical protein [Acidimicrobiales bacterium]